MSRQTLDQQRAEHAFKAVRDVVDKPAGDSGKYKSYAKKVPMMIKTNGLGATLAFMKGKQRKENAYKLLLEATETWLKKADTTVDVFSDSEDLLKTLVTQNSDDYRRVTLEVMALYGWLRRFVEAEIVEAEIEKEDTGGD
jgi:CRISPR-associated protein Cmr5